MHVKLQRQPFLYLKGRYSIIGGCVICISGPGIFIGELWVRNWTNFMKECCFADAFSGKNMFKEKYLDIIMTWLICLYS